MKELQTILNKAHNYYSENTKCVLATIVKIDGSGYRRQGTRMLISESGKFTGAISGGCVEKEVWLQSETVFDTGMPKLITYDGRYRLGCEGTLFILIEPLQIELSIVEYFNNTYESRNSLSLVSYFRSAEKQGLLVGTYFINNETKELKSLKISNNFEKGDLETRNLMKFHQTLRPAKSLFIFGSEHDSVSLCKIASEIGWDVTIIAHPLNEKKIHYFAGAKELRHLLPEQVGELTFDSHTAVILMSHSYSRDFAYLLELSAFKLPYVGLLGPHKRKNQLLNQLIEQNPEISSTFLDNIYGPVGLDIGAETPQEIAVSILAELQAIFTKTEVDHLREKSGSIHERT